MKEIHEMILKEKMKEKPNKKFIQWLQKLNQERIIINSYKGRE